MKDSRVTTVLQGETARPALLREVFDAPVRPTEITDRLRVIAELIDSDRVEQAREAIEELATTLGDRDPEVVRLRALPDFLMAE